MRRDEDDGDGGGKKCQIKLRVHIYQWWKSAHKMRKKALLDSVHVCVRCLLVYVSTPYTFHEEEEKNLNNKNAEEKNNTTTASA